MYRSSSVQRRSLAELTGGFNETERNFFPEAGKMLSRKFRDFAGAALALSRISLMPGVGDEKQKRKKTQPKRLVIYLKY